MAKKKPTNCNCVKEINAQLEPMGAQLQTGLHIDFATGKSSLIGPYLVVERVGAGRKKLPSILCTYCPCCGKKREALQ